MLTEDERIKLFQGYGNNLVHTTMERYSGSATGMDHYKGMPGLGVDKNYQLPGKYFAPMRRIAAVSMIALSLSGGSIFAPRRAAAPAPGSR